MRIHFMGILGSGLAGVASLASKMGYEVTGCDLEDGGHNASHLKGVDLLVVTPAVFWQSAKHPELVEGQRQGIVMTWQEFLGRVLLKDKKVIAIAGTHGKSTTTAMAAKLLIDNGSDPVAVAGAFVPEWAGNSRFGKGDYAVVEADEFNDNFLNYSPEIAIINNIEFDHPDYFKNEAQVKESFEKFEAQLVGPKFLITEAESLGKRFSLKVWGEHNQKNANMVYLLGKKLGIKDEDIVASLESFEGIGRRMELVSDRNGIRIYDDYAHHPTAIKTTLEGLREKYSKERILAIIEPHGYKRTKALLSKYKGVFDAADKVIIGPIFQARDKIYKSVTSEKIAEASKHPNISVTKNLKLKTDNYDVVIVMGAGRSNLWARKIAGAISGQAKKTFRELTSFRIGGVIGYYKEAATHDELVAAVGEIKKKKLPVFVIGGGTDILVSDSDFNGAVIKYIGKSIKCRVSGIKYLVTAEAGMEWDKLVEFAVKKNLQGIECLSGIPGTVGAAPIQNIGAYGQELKDTFVSLTAYDIEKEKFIVFDGRDCGFSYRESFFKKPKNWQRFIITDVTLKLKKYNDPDLTLKNIRDEILRVRSEKFESPNEAPNAGSFFKNPVVDSLTLKSLLRKFPDIKHYGSKLSAGWLIEKAGWRGKSYKGAAVSSRHALVLVNPEGKAKASDVVKLSEEIIDDVEKKFGIRLEREVQLINFRKVAILGYGIEGQDAEKYFEKQGAEVTILDKKFDKGYLKDLARFDLIVRSPGVYPYKPELKNVTLTSPIRTFFNECKGMIIGVTGTKGKGTTSSLIYEILKKAGKDVYLAGNIGQPYLELLSLLHSASLVILEMSSFQLIDITTSPHIAVILNITSDHMDWHKNQKEYVDAKKNIVRYQNKFDFAVINGEYEVSKSFAKETGANVAFFSKRTLDGKFKEKLLLRGEHNLENIAAAVAVSRILKIDDDITLKVVRSFKGLEHRLELVTTVNGVTFYNDSFATGPQPTIAAIKSFTEPETLILGGSDKGLDYKDLRREIEKRENVRNLVLIGKIGEKIGVGIKGKNIINLGKTSMNRIIEVAYRITPKGGVVLLSPAAASFDMFENYKDRGNQFKEAVKNY